MKQVVYDMETGLIHRVVESMWGGETVENLRLDKHKYNSVSIDAKDIDPFKDAVLTGKYGLFNKIAPMSEVIRSKIKIEENFYKKVGWITSYGIKCGIAKYSEYILEHFLPDCIIFSNYDSESEDERVCRAWELGAEDLDNLYDQIMNNGVDCVVIQFGNGFFKDEAIIEFVEKLKREQIRIILTLHTLYVPGKLLKMADDIILTGTTKNTQIEKSTMAKVHYIPIGCFAPVKKHNGVISKLKSIFKKKDNSITIGTFGFMFPHKQFELVMDAGDFIQQKLGKNVNINIYASYHTDKKDVCEIYHNDIKQNVFYSKCNIKINTDFLSDEEILAELGKCDFLVFPYATMAGQIQSAAVNMGISAGPAVITSDCFDVPDVKQGGPIVKINDINARKIASVIIYMLKEGSSGNTMLDNLKINAKAYRNKNSYKNVAIEYQKITKALQDVKVRVWGPTRSFFSFSNVNRHIAKELHQQGVDVSIFPDKPALDFHNDQLLNSLIHKDDIFENERTEIVMTYPPRFNNPKGNIIICPWETSKSPADWTEHLNKFEHVYGISDYNISALKKAGVKNPKKIPLGVDTKIYCPDGEKANISELLNKDLPEDIFIFLHLGHMQPRKGSDILLEAYVREFDKDENVLMLYKAHDGCMFDVFMDKIASNTGKEEILIPKYAFVMANLEEKEVAAIYRACDVLTHTHRAEGLGLPLMEALSCGLPIITTRYAGPLDFATDDNAWLIDYREVPSEYHVEVAGAKWAEPKIESIQAALRNAFENRDIVSAKGRNGVADAQGKEWGVTAYEIIKALKR